MATMRRWYIDLALSPEVIAQQARYPVTVVDALDQAKVLLEYDDADDWWFIEWMTSLGFTAQKIGVEPASFGARASYAESLAYTEHNSTEYLAKVQLSQSGIAAGTYRVGWSFVWRASSTLVDFLCRIRVNKVTVFSGVERPSGAGLETRQMASGFKHVALAAGDQLVTLEFATADGKRTVGMENARLEFYRVG